MRAAALVLAALVPSSVAVHAQTTDLPPPAVEFSEDTDREAREANDQKLRDRLTELEGRLERVEQKLDGIETLLRMIYAERIRRIEKIAEDEGLAAAVKDVQERYGLSGVVDALTSDDPERLTALQRSLAKAAAAAGAATLVRDRSVIAVLAAMADRTDFLAKNVRTFVSSIAGRDNEAARSLALALLASPQTGAHEAALWAAIRLASPELAPTVSGYASSLDVASPRLAGLACAAAGAAGDARAVERLATMVSGGALPGSYAYQLANELRAAGKKVAFRVYLELLMDEQYAFAAAQAFSRIEGFERRVSWREVKGDRAKLHAEFRTWLDGHWSSIQFDKQRGKFKLSR